jgi:hypothetical protein
MRPRASHAVVLSLVLVFLIGPFLIIVAASLSAGETLAFPPQGLSLRWFAKVFEVESFRASFLLSLGLAIGATVAALGLGIPAAYALSRYKVPFGEALRTIVSSPIIVPGIVVGLALLRYFVVPFHLGVVVALFLAHTALVLPYALRVVSASLNNLRPDIEEAAILLGVSRRAPQRPGWRLGRAHSRLRHQLQPGAGLAVPVGTRGRHAAGRHALLSRNHLRPLRRGALDVAGAAFARDRDARGALSRSDPLCLSPPISRWNN